MPDAELFLHDFDLFEGSTFGKYKIDTIEKEEHSLVRWVSYSYSITLLWQGKKEPTSEDRDTAIEDFKAHIAEDRIIRTPSRAYLCRFVWPTEDHIIIKKYRGGKKIKISCTGYAKRVSEAIAAGYN